MSPTRESNVPIKRRKTGRRPLTWSQLEWNDDAAAAMPQTRADLDDLSGVGGPVLRVELAALSDDAAGVPSAEIYELTASPASGDSGAVLTVGAASAAALRHAKRAVTQLVRSSLAHDVHLCDWPTVPRRGYLECFYGPLWERDDRNWLLDLAAEYRMNVFAYGPPADERTGTRWREPYPAAELSAFADLVRRGAAKGIDVAWRVSPCAPLRPSEGMVLSDDNELALLIAKCEQLLAAGVRSLLVAFDDLDGGFAHPPDKAHFGDGPAALATAHADITNRVARALSEAADGVALAMCPTDYWGVGPSPYRARLGQLLADGIEVCWTGNDIVASTIAGHEAATVRAELGGRPLWLWDNYPVNDWGGAPVQLDGSVNTDLLFLGPLCGRTADVGALISTYTVQGAIQAAATAPAVISAAQWAWDPDDYTAEAVWTQALDRLDDGTATLHAFAALHRTSRLEPQARSPLADSIWRYLQQFDGEADPSRAAAELDEQLTDAEQVANRMATAPLPSWTAVLPWSQRLRAETRAARLALRLTEALRTGSATDFATHAPQFRASLRECSQGVHPLVAGGALEAMIQRGRVIAGSGGQP